MNNFTNDELWRKILYFRYPFEKVFSSKNLDFVDRDDFIECKQNFQINVNEEDLLLLEKLLEMKEVKFKYMNENFYKLIKDKFSSKYTINIDSKWVNPIIKIEQNQLKEYIDSKNENIKRDYKKYLVEKESSLFYDEENNDFYDLWKNILFIDQSSWKKTEETDMMNLEYEHLQYMFFCLKDAKYYVDIMCDKNKEPIGYSLMFEYDNILYAAKWGATDEGRKNKAGIVCFFRQLERLSKNRNIVIDTWSRNNLFFEKISNEGIARINLTLRRKNGNN